MSRTTKILAAVAVVCAIGSVLLLFGGPRYAISQIPAAQRATMSDFDWIGVEWVERAMVAGAFAVAFTGAAVWAHRPRRGRI